MNIIKRRIYIPVALILVAVLVIGTVYSSYQTNNERNETAELADYEINVIDIKTQKEVEWTINIPATTKFEEDENFDKAFVVKNLKITNNGEDTLDVQATFKGIVTSGYHGNQNNINNEENPDIIVFVFPEIVNDNYSSKITTALKDENGDWRYEGANLYEMVEKYNTEKLNGWSGDIAPGQEKFLTVVVWRENTDDNPVATESVTVELQEHLELFCKKKGL